MLGWHHSHSPPAHLTLQIILNVTSMIKKIAVVSIVSFFLAGFVPFVSVSADTQCGNPALNTASSTTQLIACGNGPVISQLGPIVAAGSTITDAGGVASLCPSFLTQGCVDLTSTVFYQSTMRALVSQLTANGFLAQFPMLRGWIGR